GLVQKRVEARLAQVPAEPAPAGESLSARPPLAVAPFDAQTARMHQVRWARHLGVPVEFENSIGMKFVLIPPGPFMMGSTEEEVEQFVQKAKQAGDPKRRVARLPGEAPRHRVRITRPFFLGVCEVTQSEYERIAGSNPSHFRGNPVRPVERVTWHNAVEFCRRLGEVSEEKAAGAVYRLPTEAEWEYACRAGTATSYSFGNDPALLGHFAWWAGNSQEQTQPVGQLKPNAFGLFDMHGNVFEWCADWYAADYYAKSPERDPPGPDTGESRVTRGVSWRDDEPEVFRCAWRYPLDPVGTVPNFGFRVALNVPEPDDSAKQQSEPAGTQRVPGATQPHQPLRDAPPPAIAPFDAATARKHQQAWARHLQMPVEHDVDLGGGVKLTLVLIPPGEFLMGSPEAERQQALNEAKAANDSYMIERIPSEVPHRVKITKLSSSKFC
ncbi:MAG: formylglycine-generating enzyme family protein, partial [Thermoguttaceae bacterium]|nr:formylglycine-generating enzyme family protein [Thermoguttaceae bacterium]